MGAEPDPVFRDIRMIQVRKSLDKVDPYQLEYIGNGKTGFDIRRPVQGQIRFLNGLASEHKQPII